MTYVIAEAGVNHGGDFHTALGYVQAAKDSGADAVKFQHFSASALGQPDLKRFELNTRRLFWLKEYAGWVGIDFICTPFGVNELFDLLDLGCETLKLSHRYQPDLWAHVPHRIRTIASAPDLKHAAELAVTVQPAVMMYCATDYPTDPADVDLRVMDDFAGLAPQHGYSDHTRGIETCIEAVKRGASVIEKHFTLGGGFEDAWSATPEEFAEMVGTIREA